MPDKKDAIDVLTKEIEIEMEIDKDKFYSTKCYPINYLHKCESFLTY
jgi:hypothetical protein